MTTSMVAGIIVGIATLAYDDGARVTQPQRAAAADAMLALGRATGILEKAEIRTLLTLPPAAPTHGLR